MSMTGYWNEWLRNMSYTKLTVRVILSYIVVWQRFCNKQGEIVWKVLFCEGDLPIARTSLCAAQLLLLKTFGQHQHKKTQNKI